MGRLTTHPQHGGQCRPWPRREARGGWAPPPAHLSPQDAVHHHNDEALQRVEDGEEDLEEGGPAVGDGEHGGHPGQRQQRQHHAGAPQRGPADAAGIRAAPEPANAPALGRARPPPFPGWRPGCALSPHREDLPTPSPAASSPGEWTLPAIPPAGGSPGSWGLGTGSHAAGCSEGWGEGSLEDAGA